MRAERLKRGAAALRDLPSATERIHEKDEQPHVGGGFN
jgi:hypothetical protein